MDKLLAQYSNREKTIVALALVVVLALACHAFVIEPYQQRIVELEESIDQHNADLNWMRSVVPGLPIAGAEITAGEIEGTLANFIDQAVRNQGLNNQLSQMSPVGNDEIRVRYSAVGCVFDSPFDGSSSGGCNGSACAHRVAVVASAPGPGRSDIR